MNITQYYPVLQVRDVAMTVAFYRDHFDFDVQFDSDWYVHLQSRHDPSVNLAILDGFHETIPVEGHGVTTGMILNLEIEDVDAMAARATAAGLPMLKTLRDEPFGQRHYITADPNGVMIDVIKPIPPSAEFIAQFSESALAETTA
jgi:uncharacterized glyoxalase superfamily protein PhnB